MEISINGNFEEVQKILESVPVKIAQPALIQALNRVGRDARNAGRKALRNVTGISPKAARTRIRGATKKSRATRKQPNVRIFVRTEKPIKYSKGFSKTKIRKNKEQGSFLATMPDSGKFSRWKRQGAKRKPTKGFYAGKNSSRGERKGQPILRQPIVELEKTLHPHGTRAAQAAIFRKVRSDLSKQVKKSVNLKLSKMKR